MSLFDQIEEYRKRVLIAHWEAFNCIKHAPTKGKMRERTVRTLLQEEYNITPVSGIACDDKDDWQSPEIDIMLLSRAARRGIANIYHLDDIVATCEVKSFASSNDFTLTEKSAEVLKNHSDSKIVTTLFAFATRAKRETVCAHFGFSFDPTIEAYTGYCKDTDDYGHIDHFISLDACDRKEPFLITRSLTGERSLQIGGRPIEQFLKLFQLDCF